MWEMIGNIGHFIKTNYQVIGAIFGLIALILALLNLDKKYSDSKKKTMNIFKVNSSGKFAIYGQNTILKIDASILNNGFCVIHINNITVQIKYKGEKLNYQIAGDKRKDDGIIKVFLKGYINYPKISLAFGCKEKIEIQEIPLYINKIINKKTIKGKLMIDTEIGYFRMKKYKFKCIQIDKFKEEPRNYLVSS